MRDTKTHDSTLDPSLASCIAGRGAWILREPDAGRPGPARASGMEWSLVAKGD